MNDMSVRVSLEITRLTRNETAAAIDAAPDGSTVQLGVLQPDSRRAGRRYDVRVENLTMTAGRDLLNAVHGYADSIANQSEGESS